MKKSSSQREFDLEIKKRRLRSDQVKALERSFEVLNKLEPERKVQLAIELGLDPRQVAIWFQNRRARWKIKQLERDYLTLQSAYDDMKRNYDAVKLHNESLLHQIGEMKASMVDEDDAFGFSLNYEAPFYSKPIAVSSDSAMSEDYGTPNCVVSSYDIWPAAATCSFLGDEEPAPTFNWYCPPNPWT